MAVTCSLARAQRFLWAADRCPQSACEAESVMPPHLSLDPVEYRVGSVVPLIRRKSSHDSCHESRLFLFKLEKLT